MARNNTASADAVADYFLLKILVGSGDSITNLKMQKMVYYTQAWCLALYEKPMFEDRIEAWASGPVCPTLYKRLRKQSGPYNWDSIDPTRRKTQPLDVFNKREAKLLDNVWDYYSRFSNSELSAALTNGEPPWQTAYSSEFPGGRCNEEITHKSMKKFYKKLCSEKKKPHKTSSNFTQEFQPYL